MFLRLVNRVSPPNGLRREMTRLFDDFCGQAGVFDPFGLSDRGAFPSLNVWEEDDKLVVEAEVPGLKMDDLEILVSGNELTVRGQREAADQEGVCYHRRERGVGAFSRAVRLPVDIEAGKVEAQLSNGVLTIVLPKAEAARPRKVEVKAGQ